MHHRAVALFAALLAACAGARSGATTKPAAGPPSGPAAATPAAARAPVPDAPPPTPARPAADEYHGVRVEDPYRWLEDPASAEVKAWTAAQDARTRRFLAALPGRDAIAARVQALLTARTVRWAALTWRAGRLFALRREATQQQPVLVVLASPDDPAAARVVLDPAALDPSGGTAIDFYAPSPDGRRVAVSLSKGGTEAGDLHFYDVDSGKPVAEIVPRVNGGTAGGSAAWAADGSGVFYTRYPRPGEQPPGELSFHVQVFFHRLGTRPEQDRYELGKEFPRTAEIELYAQERTGRVLAIVQEGDSGRFRHWLRDRDGRWMRFTDYGDAVGAAEFGAGNALYVLSRKGAPRGRILRIPLPRPSLAAARVVVPESDAGIDWTFAFGPRLAVTRDRIYAVYQLGGPSELRAFDLRGRRVASVSTPGGSAVPALVRFGKDGVLFQRMSYLEPPAWYRVEGAGAPARTALATQSPADFSDAETRREWAVSKDGTRVPVTVVLRKGTPLDGSSPLLATGYGGYGISEIPRFDPTLRIWLDRGGVYAVVHVRGGGEFGEAWHAAGSGLAKQNTFDDFAAGLELLVSRGYTRPARLAIEGGSNGGILMGAMMTQHPAAMHAVVSHVGVYDMLRNETTLNGTFNVPEYGTVKDRAQFEALYAYSPYHHVRAGTAYPAVLLLTGANDPRVDSWHSKKLAAALQAASTSGMPVLLRVEFAGGHGFGASLAQHIEQSADVFAFLFEELGMKGPAAAPAPAP
jgi:prolyl oligopeptidase